MVKGVKQKISKIQQDINDTAPLILFLPFILIALGMVFLFAWALGKYNEVMENSDE